MKQRRGIFTYANVVASLALFLAVSGGVVYAAGGLGKNVVKSKNIAAKAVKSRNIAKNAVTGAKIKKEAVTAAKVKKGTLTRTQLAAGTLAGLQVVDATSASVPGLNTETTTGTPVPLTGTASFTPVAGKSYEALLEIKGNPVDADGPGGAACFTGVTLFDNGAAIAGAFMFADASAPAPFNFEPMGQSSVPVGLLSPGQTQTLSVTSFGDTDCGTGTTAALRLVVVEFG